MTGPTGRVEPPYTPTVGGYVFAAGLAGILTGLVFVRLTNGGTEWAYSAFLSGLLGVATAMGRAAVIPTVRWRKS